MYQIAQSLDSLRLMSREPSFAMKDRRARLAPGRVRQPCDRTAQVFPGKTGVYWCQDQPRGRPIEDIYVAVVSCGDFFVAFRDSSPGGPHLQTRAALAARSSHNQRAAPGDGLPHGDKPRHRTATPDIYVATGKLISYLLQATPSGCVRSPDRRVLDEKATGVRSR
jgi:hypothetical protein